MSRQIICGELERRRRIVVCKFTVYALIAKMMKKT
jgi:hypothetical protein